MIARKKIKLIVSDFHLGRGRRLPDGSFNFLEDFRYDDAFVEFLDHYRTGDHSEAEIELICNGDFFNHLQIDIHDPSPDVLDEATAITRTDHILKGHPELFDALKRFAASPNHSVTFTLGNHDAGLLFPSVHRKLRETLGDGVQVKIGRYVFDDVLVEHGHQYFADNAYDTQRYFLTEHLPAPVVNLPWGSYFVIFYINPVKKERPYFDKVYPFKNYLRWALIHDTWFAIRSVFRIVFYFLWVRFTRDPHRRSPILKTLKIIQEVPISPKLDREAKKILLSQKDIHIVVFSHTHHAVMRQFAPNKVYINTGLWNEQISLEISDLGKIVRLTYAHLEYDEHGRVNPSLKEWKGSHKMIEDIS